MLASMTAQTPFPLPRQLRESTLNVGDGTAGPYGPSTYRVWDVADVKVFARAQGEKIFTEVTDACTIAKTAGEPFDTFSVTFGAAVPATTDWYSQARRTHERMAAATQGGALSGLEIEKELSRQATVLSELRRDADRALKVDLEFDGALELPVLGDAQTFMWDEAAKRFVPGPTAGEIEAAQGYAEAAHSAADAEQGSAEAAQSAADRAEAASALFPSLAPGDSGKVITVNEASDGYVLQPVNAGSTAFETRAAATSFVPAASAVPDFVWLSGYAAAEDGGGARYVKVGSEPSHEAKFSLTDSGGTAHWYELQPDRILDLRQVTGPVTGNAATDGAAFEKLVAFVAATAATGLSINVPAATYTATGTTELPSGNIWEFNGSRLDYSGVADAALVTIQGGKAMMTLAGSGGAVGVLTHNISRGTKAFQFTAHGLAVGDVIAIHNDADYSWSNARTYYHAGELNRVRRVVDANNVVLERPFYEFYTAGGARKLEKFDGVVSGEIRNLRIVGKTISGTPTFGLVVDYAQKIVIDDVSASNVSYNSHIICRTLDFQMKNCWGEEDGVDDFGGDYGLGVYSSQNGRVENCHFRAARHAIANGNIGSGVGNVPSRDIHYDNCSAEALTSEVLGFDVHACADRFTVTNCRLFTGMTMGAPNAVVRDCYIQNAIDWNICFMPPEYPGKSGNILIENCTFRVNGPTSSATRGVIDCTSNVPADNGSLTIRNCRYSGNASNTTAFIVAENHDTYYMNIVIDGLEVANAYTTTLIHQMNVTGAVARDQVSVQGLRGFVSGGTLFNANSAPVPTNYRFPMQSGTITSTTGTSTSKAGTLTFPWAYPAAPAVTVNVSTPATVNSGTRYPTVQAHTIGGASFVWSARTDDYSVAFASDVTLGITWQAVCQKGV